MEGDGIRRPEGVRGPLPVAGKPDTAIAGEDGVDERCSGVPGLDPGLGGRR